MLSLSNVSVAPRGQLKRYALLLGTQCWSFAKLM
jgi:hypothetical protein